MTRKRQQFGISINKEEQESLEVLAFQHGALWGDHANISRLIRMIASKDLLLHRPELPIKSERDRTFFLRRIEVLESAIAELKLKI